MFKLVLSREASRFYQRCDNPAANKLARCFAAMEQDPRGGNNVKPLKGQLAGAYRYRVGDLRVVYTINDATTTVFIITIANRKGAYK